MKSTLIITILFSLFFLQAVFACEQNKFGYTSGKCYQKCFGQSCPKGKTQRANAMMIMNCCYWVKQDVHCLNQHCLNSSTEECFNKCPTKHPFIKDLHTCIQECNQQNP